MTRNAQTSPDRALKPDFDADTVVMVSMALVAVAIGAGLWVQAGASLLLSIGMTVAVFALLASTHFLLGPAAQTGRAAAGTGALEAEAGRRSFVHDIRSAPVQAQPAAARADARRSEPHMPKPAAAPPPIQPSGRVPAVSREFQGPPPLTPWVEDFAASLSPVPPPAAPRPAPASNPAAASVEPIERQWSYRPAAPYLETAASPLRRAGYPAEPPALPSERRIPLSSAAAPAERPVSPGLTNSAPREADVEMIQNLIKKLADEVNGTGPAAPPPLPRAAHLVPAAAPDGAITSSIEALRTTAETMRQASAPARAAAPAVAHVAPPPVNRAEARATQLADAIAADRIDVFLEPILGLADQRARHYEVSMRLRGTAGTELQFSEGEPGLAGTGLLPLFDRARTMRAANVARRLSERGKVAAVFSGFNGETLADRRVMADAAQSLAGEAASGTQLVLTFAQSDVRAFAAGAWAALTDMRDAGFRFAVAGVVGLDMDFAQLAAAGFEFVKLDADVFLEGLPLDGGIVPSRDVCQHLSGLGLTLVVEHIEDEAKLARVFGSGALLGQGQLFGAPRPVKAEATHSHAAA